MLEFGLHMQDLVLGYGEGYSTHSCFLTFGSGSWLMKSITCGMIINGLNRSSLASPIARESTKHLNSKYIFTLK